MLTVVEMGKRKRVREPLMSGEPSDINRLIANFMHDVAKEFSEEDFSGLAQNQNESLVYGFNVRIGPDGKPTIESFGNLKPEKEILTVGEEREPLVDVIERESDTTIMAELPGMKRESITVTASPYQIKIEATQEKRGYNKNINLKSPINTTARSAKYHNGVIELIFGRAAGNIKKVETIVEIK